MKKLLLTIALPLLLIAATAHFAMAGTISGTVYGDSAMTKPLSRVFVTIELPVMSSFSRRTTYTDSYGTYSFTNLPENTLFTLIFIISGYNYGKPKYVHASTGQTMNVYLVPSPDLPD